MIHNRQTDRHTYSGDTWPTRTCSLCATRNGMKAPFAPPIFHTYHQGPLNFSKDIVSLVHHGAYCALVVHIAPWWCTSTPYTIVVVHNAAWVNPDRQTTARQADTHLRHQAVVAMRRPVWHPGDTRVIQIDAKTWQHMSGLSIKNSLAPSGGK